MLECKINDGDGVWCCRMNWWVEQQRWRGAVGGLQLLQSCVFCRSMVWDGVCCCSMSWWGPDGNRRQQRRQAAVKAGDFYNLVFPVAAWTEMMIVVAAWADGDQVGKSDSSEDKLLEAGDFYKLVLTVAEWTAGNERQQWRWAAGRGRLLQNGVRGECGTGHGGGQGGSTGGACCPQPLSPGGRECCSLQWDAALLGTVWVGAGLLLLVSVLL